MRGSTESGIPHNRLGDTTPMRLRLLVMTSGREGVCVGGGGVGTQFRCQHATRTWLASGKEWCRPGCGCSCDCGGGGGGGGGSGSSSSRNDMSTDMPSRRVVEADIKARHQVYCRGLSACVSSLLGYPFAQSRRAARYRWSQGLVDTDCLITCLISL